MKSAFIVSKVRLIVLLTKQVVLKSGALLMASRWKEAQKHTTATVDPLLKTKTIPFAAHAAGILSNSPIMTLIL